MPGNHWSHVPRAAKAVGKELGKMKPLKQKKNPVIAFILGILLQGIGVGLYLESWKDFFVCVGIFVLFFGILLPTVVGEELLVPAAALFCGIYGAWRAVSSNRKLARRE
jgi:hypothetical protein